MGRLNRALGTLIAAASLAGEAAASAAAPADFDAKAALRAAQGGAAAAPSFAAKVVEATELSVAASVSAGTNEGSEGGISEDSGARADGLRFATSHVADFSRCRALRRAGCADEDQDGLNDAWEDGVLRRFEPRLEFDEQERGLKDPAFRMGAAGRVVRRKEDATRIVVFFAFAFSEDYGACSLTEHHGDVERAVIELRRVPGTDGDVILTRAFTAAHEGGIADKSRLYEGADALQRSLEFVWEAGSPRWLLYTSRNKHGTFASKAACEARELPCLADYCGADGAATRDAFRRLLPILNAGEPGHPRDSGWASFGYEGVDAWSPDKFCGSASSGDCDAAPRGSLIRDPFTRQDL